MGNRYSGPENTPNNQTLYRVAVVTSDFATVIQSIPLFREPLYRDSYCSHNDEKPRHFWSKGLTCDLSYSRYFYIGVQNKLCTIRLYVFLATKWQGGVPFLAIALDFTLRYLLLKISRETEGYEYDTSKIGFPVSIKWLFCDVNRCWHWYRIASFISIALALVYASRFVSVSKI